MEVSQHSKYSCKFCGKFGVKRKAVGIWNCKDCGKVKSGGAYTLNKYCYCAKYNPLAKGAD